MLLQKAVYHLEQPWWAPPNAIYEERALLLIPYLIDISWYKGWSQVVRSPFLWRYLLVPYYY